MMVKSGKERYKCIYMESIGSEWKIGMYLLFRQGDSPLEALRATPHFANDTFRSIKNL
jgi:hypothetical protein